MQKIQINMQIFFYYLLIFLVLCSCNDNLQDFEKDIEKELIITSIAFDSAQLVLEIGESKTLTVKQTPNNTPVANYVWTSLSPDIVSVDMNGLVIAKAVGTTQIKVTLQSNQSISALCSVTVKVRGTFDFPYLIYTIQDLILMRDNINKNNSIFGNKVYKLMADLDFSNEVNWQPIVAFSGIFNGNGKIVKNLSIGSPSSSVALSAGLFHSINGGEVVNLGVIWSCLNISGTAGGITSELNGGTITNCYSKGLILGGQFAGGITGYNRNGTISNCYSTSDITSTSVNNTYCGGIAAFMEGGLIENCIALNGSLTAITVTNNSYPKRIAYIHTGNSRNNYASTTINVKRGTSLSKLNNYSDFTDKNNHGTNLSTDPIDLLNAYVTSNPTYKGIILLKWKIQSGVNNDYPVFAE